MAWINIILLIWLIILPQAHAIGRINLNIKLLSTSDWQLKNVKLSAENLQSSQPGISFAADQMSSSTPFDNLTLLNFKCATLKHTARYFECTQGSAGLTLKGLTMVIPKLNLILSDTKSSLHIPELRVGKGRLKITGSGQNANWQIKLTGQSLVLAEFKNFFKSTELAVKNGQINFDAVLDGVDINPNAISVKARFRALDAQTKSGRYAAEGAVIDGKLMADKTKNNWSWHSHAEFKQGALFVDPVFLEAKPNKAIVLDSAGLWSTTQSEAHLKYLQLDHSTVAKFSMVGDVTRGATVNLKDAQVSINARNLGELSDTYLAPFLKGTAFDGVRLTGQLVAKFNLFNNTINGLSFDIDQFNLIDAKNRLNLSGAKAIFSWQNQPGFQKTGFLEWQQLKLFSLPFSTTKLNFKVNAERVELLQPVNIGFLDGNFAIDQLGWQISSKTLPELHFSGALQNISLAKLSEALNWTPLSGEVSGVIPGINYRNHRLDLDGALNIQVFDGTIKVNELAVANLLSDRPKFYSDIQIDRLNLKQLTEKFKFGSIEGLISGYIKDLYLENWQPVSFYAWLGTPENDTTTHRISQKAVDNIASIGGGGATDLFSRSILGLFDSFGYSRLGLGCYLHAGVCQLMALEPAKTGYYMIKGGGLPKIDVIGYNPRVDWRVLVDRLGRINAPDRMVVQ